MRHSGMRHSGPRRNDRCCYSSTLGRTVADKVEARHAADRVADLIVVCTVGVQWPEACVKVVDPV
jgi:hypothetical protein